MGGVPLVGLFPYRFIALRRLIADDNGTGVAVQLEVDGASTVRLHLADGIELDDQGLACFNVEGGLLPRLKTVEEDRCRDDRGVGILLAVPVEFGIDIRIKDGGNQRLVINSVVKLLFQFEPLLVKIYRFKQLARPAGDRLLILEDDLLQLLRPPLIRLTEHPLEHADNRFGKSQLLFGSIDILGLEIALHQEHRHIADHLGGRCYLDDVAEHHVDLVVHLLALIPALDETEPGNLRFVVGVLAAGNLVMVDLRSS